MNDRVRRTWAQRGVLTINILGIVAALGLAWVLDTGEQVASSVNRVDLFGSLTPIEEPVDGEIPPFNVLLVGYDSAANLDPDDPVAIGRQGERLADVIIIARVDQQTGSARLLSIPRDLWVEVPGYEDQKINSSFQLGGPGLLIETIENHLDIPINNYASVDLAGFEGLVDVVDHVDLFFEHPARDFNPAPPSGPPRSMSGFAIDTGGCQSLEPTNALAFVRSRNFQFEIDGEWVTDGQRSDLERIRRQQLFVESFLSRALDLGARNPLVLRELVTAAVPHLTLDQELTPQALIDLSRAFDSFDADELESYSLPTEFGWERNRTVSVVRTLDDEAAPLVRLFQGVDGDDPSTVGLAIRSVASETAIADQLGASIEAEGYEPPPVEIVADLPFGVTVAFGRDGGEAVLLVLAALSDLGVDVETTVLDESLPGREVIVSVGGVPPASTTTAAPTTTTPSDTAEIDGAPTTTVDEPTGSVQQAPSVPSIATGGPGESSSESGPLVGLCP